MANTIHSGSLEAILAGGIESSAGAIFSLAQQWTDDLKDSAGDYLFDRIWALTDYSLTVAAGNLDIDLYDLASIDLGAGAGKDNLGQSHANARVIAIAIRNQEITSGGTLRIDQVGAGTTAWSGFGHADIQLDLAQGAFQKHYLGESGATVTDVTDHILRLNAQTATCTIDVVFFSAQT